VLGPIEYWNLDALSSIDFKSTKKPWFLGSPWVSPPELGEAVRIRIPLSSGMGTLRSPSILKSTWFYLMFRRSKLEEGTDLWQRSIVLMNL
jgi:hypothetical protein